MPLSPDLWSDIDPPAIWVTLNQCETDQHLCRPLTVRIKERTGRSVSATVNVDRYSPEHTVFRAIEHMLGELAVLQKSVTRDELLCSLRHAVATYVEPF